MNFSALILAGGKSSRMGRDKAWLELAGQSLLARQVQLVRDVGACEVIISGRADADYSKLDCRVVTDRIRDAGPLAGIEQGLAVASSPRLLVLAVDMPAMKVEVLRWLLDAREQIGGVIPQVAGRIEPLAAIYPKSALALATNLLERKTGAAGPTDFARACVQQQLAMFLDVPAEAAASFRSVNAPEDLRP